MSRGLRIGHAAGLPAWVPEPGTFANVSLNLPVDVAPNSSDIRGPFQNWSGARFAPDFSTLGAYVSHGGGHLSPGAQMVQGTFIVDLDTMLWSVRNQPSGLHYEGDELNEYSEYADGSTYPSHTYGGLGYQPTAHGGGPKGSLLRFWHAGAGPEKLRTVHRFDLSQAVGGYSRVIDEMTYASVGNYPQVAWDSIRHGWWVLRYNGNGPLRFVSASDYSITEYAKEYNAGGDGCLTHLPEHDALLSTSYTGSYFDKQLGLHVLRLSDLETSQGWKNVTSQMTGDAPLFKGAGVTWSTLLQKGVHYNGADVSDSDAGYIVRTLDIPADMLNGDWLWTAITLTGVNGATPILGRDAGGNEVSNNGTYTRFVEAPAARCFLYAGSVYKPLQAFRLPGM